MIKWKESKRESKTKVDYLRLPNHCHLYTYPEPRKLVQSAIVELRFITMPVFLQSPSLQGSDVSKQVATNKIKMTAKLISVRNNQLPER